MLGVEGGTPLVLPGELWRPPPHPPPSTAPGMLLVLSLPHHRRKARARPGMLMMHKAREQLLWAPGQQPFSSLSPSPAPATKPLTLRVKDQPAASCLHFLAGFKTKRVAESTGAGWPVLALAPESALPQRASRARKDPS